MFEKEQEAPRCPVCKCVMKRGKNKFTHETCWQCPNLRCQFEVPLNWEDDD